LPHSIDTKDFDFVIFPKRDPLKQKARQKEILRELQFCGQNRPSFDQKLSLLGISIHLTWESITRKRFSIFLEKLFAPVFEISDLEVFENENRKKSSGIVSRRITCQQTQ
jgi:hypothetical protein